MRCVNCGNEMKASAKFCTQCGSFVDVETEVSQKSPEKASTPNLIAPTPTPVAHASYSADMSSGQGNTGSATIDPKRKNLLIVLGLVGFLAISGTVGLLLKNTFLNKSAQPSAPVVNNGINAPTESKAIASGDPTKETAENEPQPSTGEGTSNEDPEEWGLEPEEFGYVLDGSDSRYLTKLEFEGMTADTLRIARNEIYARHGRMFKDLAIQEYFDLCSWYTPSIAPDDFQQALLNNYELENLKLIISYEEEKGYR
ncbi:MAG: YARHG domain-containing protein [Youngiibacter sp.]|nr:YARHG domain-containing protein [Youngiibacter sp.]